MQPGSITATPSLAQAGRSPRKKAQPLDVINIPGAMLTLTTLSAIGGVSLSTLYREAAAGRLALTKRGKRCTRVTSESARAYLALMGQGVL